MRRYETMIIVQDSLDEEQVEAVFQRVRDLITSQGGSVVDEANWGKRELAYEINKRTHGWYGVFDYELSTDGLKELERQLKLSDDIVRLKTVRPQLRVKKVG